MDRKRVFEVVKKHLLAQGRQSMDQEGCAYRGEDGTKCAIGCLIPDSAYSPRIEGVSVLRMVGHSWDPNGFVVTEGQHPSDLHEWKKVREAIEAEFGPLVQGDGDFLEALQGLHDAGSSDWKNQLARFETHWELRNE